MMESDDVAHRLAQQLLARRIVTEDKLKIALQEQSRTGELLGRVLKNLGFARDDELSRVYAADLQLPHVDLRQEELDPEAFERVPREFAKARGLLPLRFEADAIVVAFSNPYDLSTVDAIERLAQSPVHVVVAAHDQIQAAHAQLDVDEFSRDSFESLIRDARPGRAVAAGVTAPVVALADQIILKGASEGATDIHIEPDEKIVRIRYRIDGVLYQGMTIPNELRNELISRVKIMASLDVAEKRRPQDGQITMKRGSQSLDIRVSVVPVIWGEAIVLRLLDKGNVQRSLESLGMEESQLAALRRLVGVPHGIVLVTGPTGSGKTTTLYAALKHINLLENSVLTLEDPVEYHIPLIRQSQVRPDLGFGFSEGLRALLRQDPDVIMVGEMRDPETVEIAIRAALTGHLVLATMHTNGALEALPRLNEMGVDPYLIGSSVVGLQAQRLVRRVCVRCSRREAPTEDERAFLGQIPANARVPHAVGCPDCLNTGYRGREGVFEVFELDADFRALVRSSVDHVALLEEARRRGATSMLDHGKRKVLAGLTTVDELRRVIA